MLLRLGFILLTLTFLTTTSHSYPVRCTDVGGSSLADVTDCDVINDPLPFRWTTTFTLKKKLNWAGSDDVRYIYSNAD
jgi:hypothetical protein